MSPELALPLSAHSSALEVQKYPPILSAEEEHELAIQLYENHDLSAARKLVLSHMRFVAYIAYSYKGYGLEQADLIQEGIIGLMKAVKRFNPYKKVRLSSFAVYWIRAEIHEYILKNWKIVKVATTKAQRKLFFKLKQAKSKIFNTLTKEQASQIAKDLDVKTKDVLEMDLRLQSNDIPFEVKDDEDVFTPEQYLADPNQNPEILLLASNLEQDKKQRIHKAISTLDKRSIDILQSRYLKKEKITLYRLAEKHGVSTERIRQIESKAIKKLKEYLE